MYVSALLHVFHYNVFHISDGFRKVSNIDHGGLKSDGDEVEFFHHSFLQDQEDQLQYIKRKVCSNYGENSNSIYFHIAFC